MAALFIILMVGLLVFVSIPYFFSNKEQQRIGQEVLSESNIETPFTLSSLFNIQIPNFAVDTNTVITLSNGKAEGKFFEGKLGGDETPNTNFTLFLDTATTSYAYGNLLDDGVGYATVIIGSYSGGSGYFSHLVVFSKNKDNFKYVTSIELGDRITIRKVNIDNRIISVDFMDRNNLTEDGAYSTRWFRFFEEKLIEINTDEVTALLVAPLNSGEVSQSVAQQLKTKASLDLLRFWSVRSIFQDPQNPRMFYYTSRSGTQGMIATLNTQKDKNYLQDEHPDIPSYTDVVWEEPLADDVEFRGVGFDGNKFVFIKTHIDHSPHPCFSPWLYGDLNYVNIFLSPAKKMIYIPSDFKLQQEKDKMASCEKEL